MPSRSNLTPVWLAFGLAALAAPSIAQETPRAAAFQSVLDCRKLEADAARLACYDTAAGRMATAESSGEIVIIDKAQATQAHKQAFGLTMPSLNFLTRGMSKEQVDQIEAVISSASPDPFGKWTIQLEDGAVWRMLNTDVLSRDPKAGMKVRIRRASLGSFMMNVDGQPAIRVRRD